MGKHVEEPLFQTKRRIGGTPSEFNLKHQSSNPKAQDDYFVLGRSDQRFAPSVAYRNSQRSQRTRSFSPPRPRNRSGSHKSDPSLSSQVDRQKSPAKRCTRSAKLSHSRHDEAIQTEEPRKALEQEIRRIRSEIEQRKRTLQDKGQPPSDHYQQQQQKQKQQRQHEQAYKPSTTQPDQLRLRLPRDEAIDPNSSLNAPRDKKDKQNALRSYAQRPTSYQHRDQHQLSRPTSPQPGISPARLSEYQRAYKAPDFDYVRRYEKPTSRGLDRPSSSWEKMDKAIYDTEYRREYKPFKYVSIEQLRSTTVDKDDNVHYVPLRRPISAYGTRDMMTKPDLDRALTPEPGTLGQPDRPKTAPKSHKKLRTEYNAKYRSYFKPGPHDTIKPEIRRWEDELAKLRHQAGLYRSRDRNSHFTRDHFAQLNSAFVSYWDQPSTDRYADNCQKYKAMAQMPRAGKPTESLKNRLNSDLRLNEASQLRKAMLDSHQIAELLDQNDCSADEWSTHSDLSGQCQGGCSMHSNYARRINSVQDRLAAVLPLGRSPRTNHESQLNRYSSDEVLTSDEPVQVTSLEEDEEQESEFETNPANKPLGQSLTEPRSHNSYSTKPQWYSTSQQKNHHHHPDSYSHYSSSPPPPPHHHQLGTNGSLSARSMMSSASLASATLERARKRRDLLLMSGQSRNPDPWVHEDGLSCSGGHQLSGPTEYANQPSKTTYETMIRA